MNAALIVSHGSRSPQTKREVKQLLNRIRAANPVDILEFAFLEIESPSIPEGIASCVRQGAGHVIVALNFLNAGKHVDKDIPRIIAAAKKKYPQVRFSLTRPVGQHAKLVGLFRDMIRQCL